MRKWITSLSLSYLFFLSRTSENSQKVLWDLGTVLVPAWCKLLQFVLVSKVLPRFSAAENLILCNLGQRCQLSASRCPRIVRPGCTAWGETPSACGPKGAPARHRRRGARSRDPGRYRLFPAAGLERLCITAPAELRLNKQGAKPYSILPAHCVVPGLVSLPETDAWERAVTSLEHAEPRLSDDEEVLPDLSWLHAKSVCRAQWGYCAEIPWLALQRAVFSQLNVLIQANILPDKSNTKLTGQISTRVDLYPVWLAYLELIVDWFLRNMN